MPLPKPKFPVSRDKWICGSHNLIIPTMYLIISDNPNPASDYRWLSLNTITSNYQGRTANFSILFLFTSLITAAGNTELLKSWILYIQDVAKWRTHFVLRNFSASFRDILGTLDCFQTPVKLKTCIFQSWNYIQHWSSKR